MTDAASVLFFDITWRKLSALGSCDGFGGAEYRRVKAEWFSVNCPSDVRRFIYDRANIGPYGPEIDQSPYRLPGGS